MSELALEANLTSLQDWLVCPQCKGELHFSTAMIRCTSCKAQFPQLRNDCIDLLPEPCLADEPTRWIERQREMETWYKDLIASPNRACDCFLHDYSPIASVLATLSGVVLDVGGGIGLVRHYLPRGTEYIIIDPSLQWLRTEWSSLTAHFPCLKLLPNFVRGVGEYLPFPPRAFDTVLACWSLNHTRNPGQVFREVWRVLRSSGRFLIILEDMVPDENAGDHAFNSCDITLEEQHLADAQTVSLFNETAACLQSDHIRILESDVMSWISGRFRVKQRSWIGQYLTFELTKIESCSLVTKNIKGIIERITSTGKTKL